MVTNSATLKAGFSQGHALVIAIAAYQHINPLPSVVRNDAKDIAAMLLSPDHCGYEPSNVTVLLDGAATRAATLAQLAELANRTGSDDTACVYFSGHGALRGGPDANESSLLTVDCDIADLPATSISSTEFSEALYRIKAKRLVILLDACHAGGAAILKGREPGDDLSLGFSDKALTRLAEGVGRALMASSRSNETSLVFGGARNSVFTTYLLTGLKGAADRKGEGLIRVFDLFEYLAREVPVATSDRQHPVFKATQLEQNFPIALCHTGTKDLTGLPVADEAWAILARVFPELYPEGPPDQAIWTRAGGDISRLRLHGTGHSNWFSALKVLQHGGGGRISCKTLVEAALDDYPKHPELTRLRASYDDE